MVARSSIEAKMLGYWTMVVATYELLYIKQLLKDLKFEETKSGTCVPYESCTSHCI